MRIMTGDIKFNPDAVCNYDNRDFKKYSLSRIVVAAVIWLIRY